ncbi:hypothetical protein JNB88_29315 [Rhizobium cauense]|uniref:hypothetical protein n=1 Tax=Rhizobium cauense TaxID=1166683 RepID=UPI001C6EC6F6|nr:hypothetical protein [Rhizobium cauense]MBW9117721.1 hypothetical protein [Rhizobium cauense]
MPAYQETRRFQCSGRSGRRHTVIEQVRTDRNRLGDLTAGRIDYLTEDGDVVHRLDDEHFLILISEEELKVMQ